MAGARFFPCWSLSISDFGLLALLLLSDAVCNRPNVVDDEQCGGTCQDYAHLSPRGILLLRR